MQFTADDQTLVPIIPGKDYAVLVVGDFGGGNLLLILANGYGDDFIGSIQIPGYEELAAPAAFVFTAPTSTMSVALTGSTNPSLSVDITACIP